MTRPNLELKNCQLAVPIPKEAKLLVKEGQVVTAGELLAESQEIYQDFGLAKLLQVSSQKVSEYLKVTPGMTVTKDEIIAQKKTLLGKTTFKSPTAGTVTDLLPEGILRIQVAAKQIIKSPAQAKIEDITEGNCVLLKAEAVVLTGQAGGGSTGWGTIEVLEIEGEMALNQLSITCQGKILIIAGKVNASFLHKAEALEAVGIVANEISGSVEAADLGYLSVNDPSGKIDDETLKSLKKYQGKPALIIGAEKVLEIPVN